MHFGFHPIPYRNQLRIFEMQGFSFREFLCIETKLDFSTATLPDVIENHVEIAQHICLKVKPFQYFSKYLEYGY